MQRADEEAVTLLSRDRLDGFRDHSTDTDKLLVGRYLLNAAIAEALHPLLHALEVILRNRINDAAAHRYPIDPHLPNLYNDYPSWLDAVDGPVAATHRKHVDDAKANILKELRLRYGPGAASARRMRTPGRLVAALPFSFWVYLFDPDPARSPAPCRARRSAPRRARPPRAAARGRRRGELDRVAQQVGQHLQHALRSPSTSSTPSIPFSAASSANASSDSATTARGASFTKLMGEEVEPRRQFIEQNARYVRNLDV